MVKEQIQAVVEAVLRELQLDPGKPVQVDVPRDRTHGDFSTNVALILARRAGMAPSEMAQRLVERLSARPELHADVSLAGPGFINFKLHGDSAVESLRELLRRVADLARTDAGRGTRLQLEFVSANPTGPLNVASARAASFGSTLARLLDCCGYEVQCEFYVNDAGRQVDLLGASVRARFVERTGVIAPFPEEGYQGDYVRDVAAQVPEADGRAWLLRPDAEASRAFGDFAVASLVATQRTDLERFGVRYDRWFRESELHASGAVQDTLRLLQASGHVYEEGGALYFRTTTWGDDKDRVLVRSDGTPTYFLADAAYHRDKHERGFRRVVDVWGPDHHGHIPRMQAVARALGYPEDWLQILVIQWVNLVDGGEARKMSKRAGQLVTLRELLDEVGVDVAKYFFLMRHHSSHLDFDLALARKQSDDNPVFYVKYAHARICSVIDKAAEAGLEVAAPEAAPLERLVTPAELELAKLLAGFPALVRAAAEAREPHRLTGYCDEVARAFHQFYHQHRVIQEDRELALARLGLCHATRRVLAAALDLMSIEAPRSM